MHKKICFFSSWLCYFLPLNDRIDLEYVNMITEMEYFEWIRKWGKFSIVVTSYDIIFVSHLLSPTKRKWIALLFGLIFLSWIAKNERSTLNTKQPTTECSVSNNFSLHVSRTWIMLANSSVAIWLIFFLSHSLIRWHGIFYSAFVLVVKIT